MTIHIKRIELFVVDLPMTEPFRISFGTVSSRRLVIVKLTDADGCEGWGEAATLDLPIYKADFPETVIAVIERAVWPAIQAHGAFASPEAFDEHLSFIRGHYFAKAALSMAVYDIAAQKAGKNIAAYIGGESTSITLSRTLSIMPDVKTMLAKADEMASAGFRYLKLKIAQGSDYAFAKALRDAYPDFPIMVDANAGYALNDESIALFRKMDDLNHFCLEQPLVWNDIVDHAKLQKEIRTPIALDESVDAFHDLEQALTLGSCKMLNIKVPRVGGLTAARRMYDLCLEKGIAAWVGGMIEGPIGLAAVMAFSTLKGFKYPADYIDPHYLIEDFAGYFKRRPYMLSSDQLTPNFEKHGLGVEVDYDRLCHRAVLSKSLS